MKHETIKAKRERLFKAVTGDAPNFKLIVLDNPNYQSVLASAFNYVTVKYDYKKLGEFCRTYSKEVWGINIDDVGYENLFHYGKITWLLDNGAEFPEARLTEIKKILQGFASALQKEHDNVIVLPTLTERNTSDLIAEFEGMIDDALIHGKTIAQPIDVVRNFNGKLDFASAQLHFSRQLEEIDTLGTSEYGYNDPKFNAKVMLLLKVFIKSLQQATKEKPKKERKVRIKKIVPEKMVRKLKFKLADADLGIASIDPQKLVQADILWVFNTKTRKLGRYVGKEGGLMIKGSTLYNFSEKESTSKKIRKPKEILTKLMEGGKVEQRRLLENVKAKEQLLNGRINSQTILLKVF